MEDPDYPDKHVTHDGCLLREYQIQLIDRAEKENTIIFLPTGSGKTFIALQLMRLKGNEIKKPYNEGGQRTFFLVDTKSLVQQQADVIERHTKFTVSRYTGDMNLDFWSKKKWVEEFTNNQVLVMTAQILANILKSNFISLKNINLIIFDECHHAVNDHPFRVIMKEFQTVAENEQPLVLGLSATLVNSNVTKKAIDGAVGEIVSALEVTFHARVSTMHELTEVLRYSTNPKEVIEWFANYSPGDALNEALSLTAEVMAHLRTVIFPSDVRDLQRNVPDGFKPLFRTNSTRKRVINSFLDIEHHLKDLGVYGGAVCALFHLVQYEKNRLMCENAKEHQLVTFIITYLNMIRHALMAQLGANRDRLDNILLHSSPKVCDLLKVVAKCKGSQGHACIIFVERRVTAVTLAHIFKKLSRFGSEFDFIKADFVVGGSGNPLSGSRECALEQTKTCEIIKRFALRELNTLVATNVIEEGVDLPDCNLVVKFDKPQNYRSYVQSKGRARYKDSEYIVFTDMENIHTFGATLDRYRKTEASLRRLLIGRSEEREPPTKAVIDVELYKTQIESFFVNGLDSAHVTEESAVSCIERYCGKLPHDFYSNLSPMCFEQKVGSDTLALLQLPTASPIHWDIQGDPMPNRKLAKRSAFMNACKVLYEHGELTDELTPKVFSVDEILEDGLFPHFKEEGVSKTEPQPGTKKRKQVYSVKHATELGGCLPSSGQPAYLHIIMVSPNYTQPQENRRAVFYNLLSASGSFAILSTKRLPAICDFPLYLSVGPLHCHLAVNQEEVSFSSEELTSIRKFHYDLFNGLVAAVKSFYIYDSSNQENAFYVVPVDRDMCGRYSVSWDVIENKSEFPKLKCTNDLPASMFATSCEDTDSRDSLKRESSEDITTNVVSKKRKYERPLGALIDMPSDESRRALEFDDATYQAAVLSPYYRQMLPVQYYIVTNVCHNMSPKSSFPSDDYPDYFTYFEEKYDIVILQPDQPMVEVKSIPSSGARYNFLRPRSVPKTGGIKSRRKLQEQQEDFEEHLAPELCIRYLFPAHLWLKAILLPSAIHRITTMLTVDELRRKIAESTGLGVVTLPPEMEWQALSVDQLCMNEQESQERDLAINFPRQIMLTKPKPKVSGPMSHLPWEDEQEPIDPERNMDELAPVDLQYFMEFINMPWSGHHARSHFDQIDAVRPDLRAPAPPLQVLRQTTSRLGPELAHLVQALTAKSSNDIMNLERLETLGDSFLKFAASIFLFRKLKFDEGKLSLIKGKIIGNRNLLYCGTAHGLASLVQVNEFSSSDWIAPQFCIPRQLQKGILNNDLDPSIIYDFIVPPVERWEGRIGSNTLSNIAKVLTRPCDSHSPSTLEVFVSRKTVSDKTVADCVEAMIGTYIESCGISGGFSYLNYLGILPLGEGSFNHLMSTPAAPNLLGSVTENDILFHLRQASVPELEEVLGYKFKQQAFLLEALTHPSYTRNRITNCYQRLEFIGDAILDMLITSYIYETGGDLTPGQVTDLRSALVNNVTFACLSVRHGFHKHILTVSSGLLRVIEEFVKFQETRNHIVDEAVLILMEEQECRMAEAVEVPKALGDIFESIAGAIFLDSGNSFETVWDVYYNLMKNEIHEFSKQTPKQPLRVLYESLKTPPRLSYAVLPCGTVKARCEVIHNDKEIICHGFGINKAEAKRCVAKLMLRAL